mmetsp:Transcript_108427/g.188188  ORF Transcript_108427/g.188188 Transcript_108427/m.188188 type:complete len:742 (-) Transcript_108427:77-2302(-)
MGCGLSSSVANEVDQPQVDNGKGSRAGKAATAARAQSSQAPVEASPGPRAAANTVNKDATAPAASSSVLAPLATGQQEASAATVALTVVSPTNSELETLRTPRGTRPESCDTKLRSAASTCAAASSPAPPAPPSAATAARCGTQAQAAGSAAAAAATPALTPETVEPPSSANSRFRLPGVVDTGLTPRTPRADSAGRGLEHRASSANVNKAFAALISDEDDQDGGGTLDLEEAFALLESPKNGETDSRLLNASTSDSHLEHRPTEWPTDVEVTPVTRVLLLTWARWSRNSLRIKTEERIKALQHVKYPRSCPPPRTPPLSPQPTPRETPADAAEPFHATSRSLRLGLSREETVTSRTAPKPAELLFDKMAEEQRDSMEAQAMRVKLNRNCFIEGTHTNSNKTPGFGVDTPNFPGAGAKSRASPMESVVSSGVATPAHGGQLSPWLLEAEALCNGDDEIADRGPDILRTSMAWGTPASSMVDVPEAVGAHFRRPSSLDEIPEMKRSESKASDGHFDYEDELHQVDLFNLVTDTTVQCSIDAEDCPSKVRVQVDSLASTAIPLDEEPGSTWLTSAAKRAEGSRTPVQRIGTDSVREYAVGEKVSYWSSSKSLWLPARIVEKKSRHVYLVDKQMKGCLSKVRVSELVSEAEEQQDPVLRAFCAFEPSPRGKPAAAQGRSAHRGDRSNQALSARSPRTLPPLRSTSRSPRLSGEPLSPVPPPRSPAAKPRGRIVRDDFSDDSEDD